MQKWMQFKSGCSIIDILLKSGCKLMGHKINLLNERLIITSKCNPEKDSYLNDGGGLRLRLRKNQTKYWEFRYKIQGKEIVRPFGSYPVITLKKARDMRMEAKQLVKQGIDPRDHWNQKKTEHLKLANSKFTFKEVYSRMFEEYSRNWSRSHKVRVTGIYNNYFKKPLGKLTLFEVDKVMLKKALKDILKTTKKGDTGRSYTRIGTVKQGSYILNHIFNYAEDELDYQDGNKTPSLKSLNLPRKDEDSHHKAVKKEYIGEYWHKVNQIKDIQDRVFLKLNIKTVLRINSQTGLTWGMFDPTRRQLSLPKELMKARRSFTTYLDKEMVADLVALRKFKENENKRLERKGYTAQHKLGKNDFIFINQLGRRYSNDKCAKIIQRLGENFKEATAHGNRTLFNVLAKHYAQVPSEAVEFQLSHIRGSQRNLAIHHYMGHFDDWEASRLKLIDWWGGYLKKKENAYILSVKALQNAKLNTATKSA